MYRLLSIIRSTVSALLPGIALSGVIALAVSFVAERLGGPAMLYALLFGMAFNFLSTDVRFAPGIRFASRNILRVGVTLLGLRITTTDVVSLGWPVVVLVFAGVLATILVGTLIGRSCKLNSSHAILSAGAVAICGASAALAIASVLPRYDNHERDTILTVASVTALSTLAMVLYPVFVTFLGYDNTTAGVFLGATIHDVAQVVGAGYIVSPETGEISTLVKLMRVSCLVPVVFAISLAFRRQHAADERKEPMLPWFLIAFIVLVGINSAGWVPHAFIVQMSTLSSACLVAAVAALGVRTSLQSLAVVGPAPIAVMVLQTLFLAAFIVSGLYFLG